jgi:hypothetical protein
MSMSAQPAEDVTFVDFWRQPAFRQAKIAAAAE